MKPSKPSTPICRFPYRLDFSLIPQRPLRRSWRQVLRRPWRVFCKRRRKFELTAPFRYVTSGGETVEAPAFTVVDGASIPCFCWRVIGQPWGDYAEASVIHDYLWTVEVDALRRGKPASFKRANEMFLDGMEALGVARWRRSLMWLAVTVNGWWVKWRMRRWT